MPPVSRLELADSFLGDKNNALLNLKVLVYNVNEGINCDILKKSPTLYQYSQLVALFKYYKALGPISSRVMEEIMQTCLEKGILVDLVKKHGKTLLDFLHYEISQEEAVNQSRDDGYEAGIADGLREGLSQGTAIGRERVNKLNQLLVDAGRLEDLKKSIESPAFQQELFEEFGLTE